MQKTPSPLSQLPPRMRLFSLSISLLSSKFPLLANLRRSPLHVFRRNPLPMDGAKASLRIALMEKQIAIDAKANTVRDLKACGIARAELDSAVEELKALKLEATEIGHQVQSAISSDGSGGDGAVSPKAFHQAAVNTLERRLFYIPSFKIYRGVARLYDYGPPG